jgi:hypothetical protein
MTLFQGLHNSCPAQPVASAAFRRPNEKAGSRLPAFEVVSKAASVLNERNLRKAPRAGLR